MTRGGGGRSGSAATAAGAARTKGWLAFALDVLGRFRDAGSAGFGTLEHVIAAAAARLSHRRLILQAFSMSPSRTLALTPGDRQSSEVGAHSGFDLLAGVAWPRLP